MFSFTASLLLAAGGTLAAPSDVDQLVEREFRLYRIQVYNTYRTWRSEYDRRRLAGDAAYGTWKNAGAQPQQAQELVMWFRGAKTASLAHVNRPLPALPEFPPPAQLARAPSTPAPPRTTDRPPAKAVVERFEVRRLEESAAPRPVALAANKEDVDAARPTWKSVSSALYKGMVFGASRAMSK
jgi:hypothetical protein